MTIELCDICKINEADSEKEYKIKVKRRWILWEDSGWQRVVMCTECHDKMFNIVKERKNGSMH